MDTDLQSIHMKQISFTGEKVLLYEELYQKILDDIKNGKLTKNSKLPSVRKTADENGISCNTVINAYNQLLQEGYIYSKEKSGFYVSDFDDDFYDFSETNHFRPAPQKRISSGSSPKIPAEDDSKNINLSANLIDSSFFPYSTLRSLYRRVLSEQNESLFDKSGDFCGDFDLRNSIADFLYEHRGVKCNAEQIIIGSGTEYILQQIIKIFCTKDNSHPLFFMESPCFKRNLQIVNETVCKTISVPLDSNGIDFDFVQKESQKYLQTQILHISPFHQFPMGITMSVQRRNSILQWAAKNENAFIIEDDYDSDFRYSGRKILSLQGIDKKEKIIYMGTFSRTLTPSMKISYAVLPPKLAIIAAEIFKGYSCSVSRIDQAVISIFIKEGFLYRHINRVKKIYRQRHDLMIKLLKEKIKNIQISGEQCGLHFIIKIPGKTEEEIILKAKEKNLILQGTGNGWLIIGYAHLNENEIKNAVNILSYI